MTSNSLAIREKSEVKFGRELRKEFLFDEKFLNLNHGSFGTYPQAIQTVMRKFQDDVEARPDQFIFYDYPPLLDESRSAIAKVLNAPVETVVFVPNATTGVNTVLRNLVFQPGDYILYFSTIYGACQKSVDYITETTPAESVCVDYTFPVEDDWLVEEFRTKVQEVANNGGKVKVAIFDTVVSVPGVRLPFEALAQACRELGVLSCLDAAHGAGHVELDLEKLDPDFFVSNCHKWLFVPRGCAVFYVPLRNQPLLRSSLPTSWGFTPKPKPGIKPSNPLPTIGNKSAWITNFEFVGTIDNSPYLCIPKAIEWRESIGGEKAILKYCHKLAKDAAKRTAEILGTEVMDNKTETLTNCCLSNVRLPLEYEKVAAVAVKGGVEKDGVGALVRGWMSRTLIDDYDTHMMLYFYNGVWWVRWSAQVYLDLGDFEWGAKTLKELSERVKNGEFIPKNNSKL